MAFFIFLKIFPKTIEKSKIMLYNIATNLEEFFNMKNQYRTHNCGELNKENVGEEVRLAGFVQTIRNLGKMIFLDLRDENGITQIVINEEANLTENLKDVNKECTITVTGKVLERASKNDKIPTGEIEVVATDLTVLGKCKANLPFEINVDGQNVREDLRLEYRFLDRKSVV